MRSLVYMVILLLATACGFSRSYPPVLDEAESLMVSDPASALSTLNGVDISEFDDSAVMARWALLYTEALVGNRLSAPTDTIVNIAIEYYDRHHLEAELAKAVVLRELSHTSGDFDELASALYLQKEKEFFLFKERARRQQVMLLGLIVALLACGVILWMHQRMRMQALQHRALITEASVLKSQIDARCSDVDRLEGKLRRLLDSRFTLIDTLCQTYYESQGTKTERKAIVDKVKSEIEAIRADSLPEMEQAVNDCRGNILVKVKECYPEIKPADYQLLVYLASGLSTRTISLLVGETVEVIYKRKSRLKSNVKIRVEPSCPEIMTIF